MISEFLDGSAIVTSNWPVLSEIIVFFGAFEGLIGDININDSLVKEIDTGAPCWTAIVERIIGSVQGPVADFALYHPSSSAMAFVD